MYPLCVEESPITARPTDIAARICLTWVVLADLLLGLVLSGAPEAWLELVGVADTTDELVWASRDLGFMLVALAMGGFFVLWSGPRRQLPIMVSLSVATLGLSFSIWTMDWAGQAEEVWHGLALGSLLHLVLLGIVTFRWWSWLVSIVDPPDLSGDVDELDELLEDELTEGETESVRLGSDDQMEEDWDADDAPPWMG